MNEHIRVAQGNAKLPYEMRHRPPNNEITIFTNLILNAKRYSMYKKSENLKIELESGPETRNVHIMY